MQDEFGLWFWLSAFAAGLLLLVLMPLCVVGRKVRPALRRGWLAAVCGLAALSAVELFSPTAIAWERALPAMACVAAAYLVFETAAAGARYRRAAIVSLAGVAVLGSLATVQASRKLFKLVEPPEVQLPDDGWDKLPAADDFAEAGGYAAATDRGTQIALYVPSSEMARQPLDESPLDGFKGRIIRVAPPDVASNCHGWAFTGGRFALRGRDVAVILRDNGYEPVTNPRPGDLVIYSGFDGKISHTGVVKAVGADYVLVESKFGPLGRYLHAPLDQCFGDHFVYYRSPRPGHLLKGL
ncbi:MAG: hypothetical protein HYS13_01750 [Planctomycetia bacterium]|nr:hypothetical protein [Planctomycetia bacterium]